MSTSHETLKNLLAEAEAVDELYKQVQQAESYFSSKPPSKPDTLPLGTRSLMPVVESRVTMKIPKLRIGKISPEPDKVNPEVVSHIHPFDLYLLVTSVELDSQSAHEFHELVVFMNIDSDCQIVEIQDLIPGDNWEKYWGISSDGSIGFGLSETLKFTVGVPAIPLGKIGNVEANAGINQNVGFNLNIELPKLDIAHGAYTITTNGYYGTEASWTIAKASLNGKRRIEFAVFVGASEGCEEILVSGWAAGKIKKDLRKPLGHLWNVLGNKSKETAQKQEWTRLSRVDVFTARLAEAKLVQ